MFITYYKGIIIKILFILHSSKYFIAKTFFDYEIGNILIVIAKYHTVIREILIQI